jgi:hypothetical protein
MQKHEFVPDIMLEHEIALTVRRFGAFKILTRIVKTALFDLRLLIGLVRTERAA